MKDQIDTVSCDDLREDFSQVTAVACTTLHGEAAFTQSGCDENAGENHAIQNAPFQPLGATDGPDVDESREELVDRPAADFQSKTLGDSEGEQLHITGNIIKDVAEIIENADTDDVTDFNDFAAKSLNVCVSNELSEEKEEGELSSSDEDDLKAPGDLPMTKYCDIYSSGSKHGKSISPTEVYGRDTISKTRPRRLEIQKEMKKSFGKESNCNKKDKQAKDLNKTRDINVHLEQRKSKGSKNRQHEKHVCVGDEASSSKDCETKVVSPIKTSLSETLSESGAKMRIDPQFSFTNVSKSNGSHKRIEDTRFSMSHEKRAVSYTKPRKSRKFGESIRNPIPSGQPSKERCAEKYIESKERSKRSKTSKDECRIRTDAQSKCKNDGEKEDKSDCVENKTGGALNVDKSNFDRTKSNCHESENNSASSYLKTKESKSREVKRARSSTRLVLRKTGNYKHRNRSKTIRLMGKRKKDGMVEGCKKIRENSEVKTKKGKEKVVKTIEKKIPGNVAHVRVLKVERGKALVLKRRHVNQLFIRGDNVIMVAYDNLKPFKTSEMK